MNCNQRTLLAMDLECVKQWHYWKKMLEFWNIMSVAKQRNCGRQSILCVSFKALMRSISRFVGENWPAGWSHPLSKPTAVVSTRKSFSRETTSFNSFLGGFMHIWVGRKWPKDWSLPQKLSWNLGTSAAQSNSNDVAGRQNNLMGNTRQRGLVHMHGYA